MNRSLESLAGKPLVWPVIIGRSACRRLTLDLQDLNNIIINQMTLFAIQPSSLIIDQLATTARMTEITDELMRQMISRAKNYYIVILKAGRTGINLELKKSSGSTQE